MHTNDVCAQHAVASIDINPREATDLLGSGSNQLTRHVVGANDETLGCRRQVYN